MEIKAKVLLRVFGFGDQDTVDIVESVITFSIDSRTIKRKIFWLSGSSSATR